VKVLVASTIIARQRQLAEFAFVSIRAGIATIGRLPAG
jgi:hypothetical protein